MAREALIVLLAVLISGPSFVLAPSATATTTGDDCGSGTDATWDPVMDLPPTCDGMLIEPDSDPYRIPLLQDDLVQLNVSAGREIWACVSMPGADIAPCYQGASFTVREHAYEGGDAHVQIFRPREADDMESVAYRIEMVIKTPAVHEHHGTILVGHPGPAIAPADGVDAAWVRLNQPTSELDFLRVTFGDTPIGGESWIGLSSDGDAIQKKCTPFGEDGLACFPPAGITHVLVRHERAAALEFELEHFA